MKILPLLIILVLIFSCNSDNQKPRSRNEPNPIPLTEDTISPLLINKRDSVFDRIKRSNKSIRIESIESRKTNDLIIEKHLAKINSRYELDFTYPYLNEEINHSYGGFNEFIFNNYVNVKRISNQIIKDSELPYETLRSNKKLPEKRIVNYSIYNAKDDLLSLVMYKENYYSGAVSSTYSFVGLNFNLEQSCFLDYDDFFVRNSEEEMLKKINEVISRKIKEGIMYYDCWEVSDYDFQRYKNNFVINDNSVEYFFDDCIICPAYTGIYSVEIPTWELKEILRANSVFEQHFL